MNIYHTPMTLKRVDKHCPEKCNQVPDMPDYDLQHNYILNARMNFYVTFYCMILRLAI